MTIKYIDIELPFVDMPRFSPRHSILVYAGLFPFDRPPSELHPVVLVYACMNAMGLRSVSTAANFISIAMREQLTLEAIIKMIGKGDFLAAWPQKENIIYLHNLLMMEWNFIFKNEHYHE